MSKLRVGVIYGGQSSEHEVSVVSAASICRRLDPSRYEAVPIRIERDGKWVAGAGVPTAASPGDVGSSGDGDGRGRVTEPTAALRGVDVVFPVLHGPFGEDGTIQGLLELAGVAYVGAGVLGSALGMDKAFAKTVLAARGLPIVAFLTVLQHEWKADPVSVVSRVAEQLGETVFVKPANLGSSVGISKVDLKADLASAMALAFEFDRKVLVEAAVPNVREIECGVLGNDDPEASVPGEITVTHRDGFYSYDAKYIDSAGAVTKIPADLPPDTTETIRRLSVEAFRALDLAGMARVDFLLDNEARTIYVNEVNTIPGFTAISMYSKMWEASGVSYPALLDRLIALARERHDRSTRRRLSKP